MITKLGLLFVYDLETATAVYRNRISPDPIFLTADAPTVGGFYAVNRRGQVLLATVNEATIIPFVSNQVCNVMSERSLLSAFIPQPELECFYLYGSSFRLQFGFICLFAE